MKSLLTFIVLVLLFTTVNAQCAFVYVSEKVNGVDIPLERIECEITINDSIVKKKDTQNDGSLGRFSLERGNHHLKVISEEFKDSEVIEFVVNESRTTNVNVVLVRLTPVQLEEKKKKLKKD